MREAAVTGQLLERSEELARIESSLFEARTARGRFVVVEEPASRDLTNREIAQALFITTRTVEGHLTSVFRKLRLESRSELRAALTGDAP